MSEAKQRLNEHGMPEYTITELVVRDDIMKKAKELASLISTTDEVRMYKEAEKKINTSEKIQTMISNIKKKQKEVVAFESFENPEMVRKIETEQTELQDELDNLPIVQQFQQTQSDINYLLQLVVSVVRDTVSEKINLDSEVSPPPSNCSE
ncbi:RicAFT regulatory complex protein RicA family protein [Chengkuizengella axinellae]